MTLALTVEKALRILHLLASAEPPGELGVTEIALRLGTNKATVFRLLKTLERFRFVSQDPVTQKYRLGLGVFEIGSRVPFVVELRRIARPVLVTLCDASRESVNLAVRDGLDALIIDTVEPDQLIRLGLEAGRREPLHATALGKALLCDFTEEQLMAIYETPELPKRGPRTLRTVKELVAALEEVRVQGFSVDEEEFAANVHCLGAPVRGSGGSVVAAISISGPSDRMHRERMKELVPVVVEAATKISSMLGWVSGSKGVMLDLFFPPQEGRV